MKKITFLLILLVLISLLGGCVPTVSENNLPSPVTPGTAADSPAPEESSVSLSGSTVEEAAFEELVFIENDECRVVITGLKPDAFLGYEINLAIENRTADKNLVFAVEDCSVNNLEVSCSAWRR